MALRSDAKIELLKSVPLFAGCSKSELRALAKTADELDLREGTVLTREGRPGREFFVLVDGTAPVTQEGKKIADLGAGDWFGEIALLTDSAAHGDRHGDVTGRRPRDHRPQLPHASSRRCRRSRSRCSRASASGSRATPAARAYASRSAQAMADSPSSARTSAKKSASGFTRYSGPSASVRSPSDVSSAT